MLGVHALDLVSLLTAAKVRFVCLVDLFAGRRIVGYFFDHAFRVQAEVDAADVADRSVEGSEDKFGALKFDRAAQQPVDGFDQRRLNRLFVFEQGGVMDARGGTTDGAEHALVKVAELLVAKGGRAAADSGDLDMRAGFGS